MDAKAARWRGLRTIAGAPFAFFTVDKRTNLVRAPASVSAVWSAFTGNAAVAVASSPRADLIGSVAGSPTTHEQFRGGARGIRI